MVKVRRKAKVPWSPAQAGKPQWKKTEERGTIQYAEKRCFPAETEAVSFSIGERTFFLVRILFPEEPDGTCGSG